MDFEKLVEATSEVLKVAPELYTDAVKPTVQESGKLIGRIPRTINAALSSLDVWILKKEYNIEETKKLLAKKLESIDFERIVSPEPYIAIPVIQAVSYCMDCDELRELYTNLLATSMDMQTVKYAHPAFVEIIKQLSPNEAKIFKAISTQNVYQIDAYGNDKILFTFNLIHEKIEYSYPEMIPAAIDNIRRLGLIDGEFVNSRIDDLEDRPEFLELRSKYNYGDLIHSRFVATPLGQQFYHACVAGDSHN